MLDGKAKFSVRRGRILVSEFSSLYLDGVGYFLPFGHGTRVLTLGGSSFRRASGASIVQCHRDTPCTPAKEIGQGAPGMR